MGEQLGLLCKSVGFAMRFVSAFAVTASLALAAPVSAATVFSDNFDSEAAALNYNSFANFSVIGQVDVVSSGTYGITCSGKCVDLDGSSGPGKLTSLSSFGFNAGDTVRLSFDLGGSQRVRGIWDNFYVGFNFGGPVQMLNYGFNFFGSDNIVLPNVTTNSVTTGSSILSDDPFSTHAIFFTAGSAGSLSFLIGTSSADNVGPLLDNVRLDISAGAVPEPANWALMIGGLALVGAAMRRRTAVSFAV